MLTPAALEGACQNFLGAVHAPHKNPGRRPVACDFERLAARGRECCHRRGAALCDGARRDETPARHRILVAHT
ncbi:unnamed protein product [Lampetra planeri]